MRQMNCWHSRSTPAPVHKDTVDKARSRPSPSRDPEASTLASARESPGACETQPGPPQACTAREATEAAVRSRSKPGPDDRRSWGRSAHTCRCSRPRHGRPRRGPAGSAGTPRCRDRADRQAGCHDPLRHDAQPPVTAIAGTRCGDSGRTDSRSATRRIVRGARTAHSTHPPLRASSGRRPAAGWSFCSTVVTDGCMTSATVTEGGAGCCAGESAMVCSLDPITLSGSGRRRTRRTRQNDDDVGGAAVGHHGGRARVRCGDLHPSDVACPGTRRFLA